GKLKGKIWVYILIIFDWEPCRRSPPFFGNELSKKLLLNQWTVPNTKRPPLGVSNVARCRVARAGARLCGGRPQARPISPNLQAIGPCGTLRKMQDRIDRLGAPKPRLLAVQAIYAVLHLPPISTSGPRPPSVNAVEGRPTINLTSARLRCYRFSRCSDPFRLAEADDWKPREGSNRHHAVSASFRKL